MDGYLSEESTVQSGVPQGSVLGPILFLIHIADIDANLDYAVASSFADDTRLAMGVRGNVDRCKLQEDMNKIYDWALLNNMQFNGAKFEMLRYVPSTTGENYTYEAPGNIPIKQSQAVRDLGIIMQNDATFAKQIDKMVEKGSVQAGWVLRTFATREAKPLLILYKALVLPHLEYCSQLWSPEGIGNIRKLENVQRGFTARIISVREIDKREQLKKFKLYSLERRRDRYTILYIYKIISGLVPNFQDERFKIEIRENERLGRYCRIPSIQTRSTCRVKNLVDSSFAVRGARLFNALPKDMRNFTGSYESFKSKLDKLLEIVPDKPLIPGYQSQNVQSNCLAHQISHINL